MQYEFHRDNGGHFHRRLVGPGGAAVALSATTFASADDARHAAVDMHRHAASAAAPDDSALRGERPDALQAPVDADEVNVVPDDASGGWLLDTADTDPRPAWYGTAGEAEHAARGYAAAHGASCVYLHDRYHRVRAVAPHPSVCDAVDGSMVAGKVTADGSKTDTARTRPNG
jgi:hypothetical protein